jgi:hypothetical protein
VVVVLVSGFNRLLFRKLTAFKAVLPETPGPFQRQNRQNELRETVACVVPLGQTYEILKYEPFVFHTFDRAM